MTALRDGQTDGRHSTIQGDLDEWISNAEWSSSTGTKRRHVISYHIISYHVISDTTLPLLVNL